MTEAQGAAGMSQRRPSKRGGGPTVRLSGNWNLPESHLLPDAVVAFVDGELSLAAHERAAMHLMRCPSCAADVDAQRQARAAVHACDNPSLPAGLLASLHSIPDTTELSTLPDNLALDAEGRLVAVQRPDRLADVGLGPAPLGSTAPLGSVGMGTGRRGSRRAVQGAGVVMSGLVLSALALTLSVAEDDQPSSRQTGKAPAANSGVRPAQFTGGPASSSVLPEPSAPVLQLGVPQP